MFVNVGVSVGRGVRVAVAEEVTLGVKLVVAVNVFVEVGRGVDVNVGVSVGRGVRVDVADDVTV